MGSDLAHTHPPDLVAGEPMIVRPAMLSRALRLRLEELQAKGRQAEAVRLANLAFRKLLGKSKFQV